MRSFRILNQRAGAVLAAASLVFAAIVPSLAAAATVTSRSIALSTSLKNASSVSYEVKFTVPSTSSSTGAFVVDFCSDPTIGATCTVPGGFSTSGVGTSGSDTVTAINTNKAVKVVLATPVAAGGNADVVLTGLHNPTNAGVFYARIVTYTDGTDSNPGPGGYGYVDPTNLDDTGGAHLDDGSVALTATDGFSVTGRALETLTFCAAASGDTIGTGCTGTLTSPSLTLGSGGILTTALSTGVVKTQVSSNAASGVVVSLKSNTTGCGGLARVGASSFAVGCGIAPITSAGAINTNDAKFGLKLANLGGASSTTTVASGSYNTTNYYMGYVGGDTSGVTGPYGDPIYHTAGPVSDGTADLTFGANISNITPAGQYTATLNLIATGTF